LPLPQGRVLNEVPGTVIEILSPDDKMGETLERFRDYAGIGVGAIVQMDPERYVAHVYRDGSLIQMDFEDLPLRSGERVPFPSQELFNRLRSTLTV
jgi:Uma2 family endonuclease